jgi:NAD(P)-dependent dehydrogenase (short-subunit alcohol dehydrogenase family)
MRGEWTASQVPDQTGRIAIVTGANSGIGFEIATMLLARGAHVVLAVRNLAKGSEVAARMSAVIPQADLNVERLDLASLASIRAAAHKLCDVYPRIDLLINNAGVAWTPRSTTEDGFETQFGINHLGHFALTGLLLDRMLPVAGSRVVTMSSLAHQWGARIRFEDLHWKRRYSREGAYAQSKLANLLFAYELQRRLTGVGTTVAVGSHPGFSASNLSQHAPRVVRAVAEALLPLVTQSAQAGALPPLRAATDPTLRGGEYIGPARLMGTRGHPAVVKSSRRSYDGKLQRRLWEVSEASTRVTFPV